MFDADPRQSFGPRIKSLAQRGLLSCFHPGPIRRRFLTVFFVPAHHHLRRHHACPDGSETDASILGRPPPRIHAHALVSIPSSHPGAGQRSISIGNRSLSEIRAAIPAHCHVRQTWKGLLYLARDLAMAALAWKLALHIDPIFQSSYVAHRLTSLGAEVARWGAWLA